MYEPPHFRVASRDQALDFVEARTFGLLVSADADGPVADPLPFLLDRAGGRLLAHVARANPQWRVVEAAGRALAVFSGADAYVSPSHYAAKREHGRVVPTWNYMVAQVRGRAVVHHDADWLGRQVRALTAAHEAGRAAPWTVDDAPADFVAAQLRAIVGIEIALDEVTAKFKLSQNRAAADRDGVARGLAGESGGAAEIAREVEARSGGSP
ncbi:MAG: FMN-binding negative transcriptional regulator [Hyphomicrobiales bacterium]|nr:FMN-binding negative transcriptional regulator [Hyphomicrobiales bacterium]